VSLIKYDVGNYGPNCASKIPRKLIALQRLAIKMNFPKIKQPKLKLRIKILVVPFIINKLKICVTIPMP